MLGALAPPTNAGALAMPVAAAWSCRYIVPMFARHPYQDHRLNHTNVQAGSKGDANREAQYEPIG
jgi:hypothetical protein